MSRKNRHILGLLDKLIELLDESQDIFFEERPWLLNYTDSKVSQPSNRREQNEVNIKKTASKLDTVLQEAIRENGKKEVQDLDKSIKPVIDKLI